VKLIALLSWYEESPSWLAALVASLPKAGVSHLVAVDGAYALFQGGRAASGTEQHEVLVETCRTLGLGLTLHAPEHVWHGNEVEKRSFMLALAETVAEPHADWYVSVDADNVISYADLVPERLAELDEDAAEARLWQRHDYLGMDDGAVARTPGAMWPEETRCPVRCLFRAIPGLRLAGNHYTYALPDGRLLWGRDSEHDQPLEPAADLTQSLVIEHRSHFRTPWRRELQKAYYQRRDMVRAEAGPVVLPVSA
jgi:hypothetical protein